MVDNRLGVAKLAQAMLESLGYRSIVVTSPAKALDTLDRTAGIALMFSDVVMPGGTNGLMLAREAMRQHPKALSAGPASCCKPRLAHTAFGFLAMPLRS